MKYVPLWGTVSHTGRTFTLHYRKNGNSSAINKQGYSPSIFNGLDIPIVRFDKAPLEKVLECVMGEVAEIEEYYSLGPWSKPISLADYLESVKARGVPVEDGFRG